MRLHTIALSILVFVKCFLVNNAMVIDPSMKSIQAESIPEGAASPAKPFTTQTSVSDVIGGPTANSDLRSHSKIPIFNLDGQRGGQWNTPTAKFTKELNNIQNFLEFKRNEISEPVRPVVPGLMANGQSKNIQILQPVSRPIFRIPTENNPILPGASPIAPPKPLVNLPASIFENFENQFSNGFRSDMRNTKNSGSNKLFSPTSFDRKSFSFPNGEVNEIPASALDAWAMAMRNAVLPDTNPMPQRNSDMEFFHRSLMRNSPIASSNNLPPNVLPRQTFGSSSIGISPNSVLSTSTSFKILLALFKMTLAEASKSSEAKQPHAPFFWGNRFNNNMSPAFRDMNSFHMNNLEPSSVFRGRSGFNTDPTPPFEDVHSQMRNYIAQLSNAKHDQRSSDNAWQVNQMLPEHTRTAAPVATTEKKATVIEQLQNYVNVSLELSQTLNLVLQQATKFLDLNEKPLGPSESIDATTMTMLTTTAEEEEQADPCKYKYSNYK